MASLKKYLFLSAAVAALATTLPAPASAQYHQFRSDKPSVEIDLGALAPENAAPAARPAWQKPSEQDLRANPPPVVLRQPLPPQKAAPVLRAPTAPETAIVVPEVSAPVPAAAKPVKRVLKPLFAAPVTPPAVAETLPAQPLAEPVPVRTPATKTANTAAAEPMEPLYERIPEIPRTAGKSSRITAPLKKSPLSYPPAEAPRGDVKHFERPVLPEGLRTDETSAAYAAPENAAPAMKAEKPATHPAEIGIATPRRPSLVIINEDPVDLPRRMPVTTTLSTPAAPAKKTDKTAATPPMAVETPRPRPEARPSLQKIQVDDTALAPATEIAALPAPKPLENIPPPLTEPELAQIGQNIEAVPARVALAPPRLTPQDVVVPTMADLTLEFQGTSSDLDETTRQKLVNIVPHLKESENRRLAVHAYASGEDGSKSSARRISLSRALAVRAFLMDNGVPPTRVDVRALGLETDRKPLERVDLVFAR